MGVVKGIANILQLQLSKSTRGEVKEEATGRCPLVEALLLLSPATATLMVRIKPVVIATSFSRRVMKHNLIVATYNQ